MRTRCLLGCRDRLNRYKKGTGCKHYTSTLVATGLVGAKLVLKFLHVHCRFGMSLGSQGKESASCDMEKTKDEEEQENKTEDEKIRDASWHDRILWDQREFNKKKWKKQRKNHKDSEKKNKKRNSSDDGSVPYGMGIRVTQLFMLAAFSTGGSHRSGSLNG